LARAQYIAAAQASVGPLSAVRSTPTLRGAAEAISMLPADRRHSHAVGRTRVFNTGKAATASATTRVYRTAVVVHQYYRCRTGDIPDSIAGKACINNTRIVARHRSHAVESSKFERQVRPGRW
jgi:hypothetical protein